MNGKLLQSIAIVLTVLLFGQILAGCGQKGDLYLPDPNKQSESKRN